MATYTKVKLSGSTDGKMIAVAQTATPGTAVHTAHATSQDELWLVASNATGADRTVTLEIGGTTAAHQVKVTVPAAPSGLFPIVQGEIVLTNAVTVAAFADATGVNITGYVNRIS